MFSGIFVILLQYINTPFKSVNFVLYLNIFSGILVIPVHPLNVTSNSSAFTQFLNKFSGIFVIFLQSTNPLIFLLVTFLLNNHSGISVNLAFIYLIGTLSGSGSYIFDTFEISTEFSSFLFSVIFPHCSISIS